MTTNAETDDPMCDTCGRNPFVPGDDYYRCASCIENANERAWERSQEGECFRGGEAAGYLAEQQSAAQRIK